MRLLMLILLVTLPILLMACTQQTVEKVQKQNERQEEESFPTETPAAQDSNGDSAEEIHAARTENNASTATGVEERQKPEITRGLLSPRGCEKTGPVMLGASPLELNEVEKIRPMGAISSFHITPTDHQYWDTIGENTVEGVDFDRFKVYAPADGYIVEIGKMGSDYRVIIEHTCTFYTIFIHIDKLSDKVVSSIKPEDGNVNSQAWPRIPVEEGEAIGSIGTGKLDFSVVDSDVTLTGFVKPESYEAESWKIHTVDTFDYYEEPLRSQLLAKNLRWAEPLGGKIDYDLEGKLVGNWFEEGTGGYSGLGNENYWTNHLSFSYDSIDPGHIQLGIGDFDGQSLTFGVVGNAPDPKDIDSSSGMVEYEVALSEYHAGNEKWNRNKYSANLKARTTNNKRGVAVFQVLPGERLKAEFFPGKTPSQVNGFTPNAIIYER